MNIKLTKFLILLLIALLGILFFYFDLSQYLTLEFLKENQNKISEYYLENKIQTIALFFSLYVLTTALSLPGATVLTLAGGGVFGFSTGLIIISFASTIGATLAFLSARFILRDYVQKKFSEPLEAINRGIEKEGAFYLFSLRLLPIFPFFMINLLMGLTPMKISTFFFTSQIGMLAGTIVYVNAGLQLAQIQSLSDILSIKLIGSFALLGVFPYLTKKSLEFFRS